MDPIRGKKGRDYNTAEKPKNHVFNWCMDNHLEVLEDVSVPVCYKKNDWDTNIIFPAEFISGDYNIIYIYFLIKIQPTVLYNVTICHIGTLRIWVYLSTVIENTENIICIVILGRYSSYKTIQ